MNLQERLKSPKTMMRIGMGFLVLASLARWFLKPGGVLSQNWTDGITGLLYGISIASLLMSIRRKARPGPA
jgi:hypothetical protein